MIYKYEDIKNKEQELKDKIIAPYKHIKISTLGGVERPNIIINISLDKRETWSNGIFKTPIFIK